MDVAVGPACDGVRLLEIGYERSTEGAVVVFHAMNARRKYLNRLGW
jgi:hypothetical protein